MFLDYQGPRFRCLRKRCPCYALAAASVLKLGSMLGDEIGTGRKHGGELASFATRFPEVGKCRYGFADWDTAGEHANGGRTLFASERGLLVAVSAMRCREAWSEPAFGEDYLKFHFRLDGANRIRLAEGQSYPVRPGFLSIISHPQGLEKSECWPGDGMEASITLACKAALIEQYFQRRASRFPGPLREFLDRGSSDFWWRAVPMSVEMHSSARSLVSSMVEARLTPLQLEALSLQLLYLGIRSLECGSPKLSLPLGNRDLRIIEHAAEVLQREYAQAPRIGCLAKRVGMNDAKLCAGFKQVFGITISDYTRHLRMRRAKVLLEESGLSVIEIALEVGYNHASNFATAFRRYYGVTPSQARRGSLYRKRPGGIRMWPSVAPPVIGAETSG